VTALVAEIVKELRNGATPRELAVRYALSARTVYRYAAGGKGKTGRPAALTAEEAQTAFDTWSRGEANMYELARVYNVHVETIRNYMKARL
jgi:DNA-binding CsgD family transcriptional regulator